MSRRILLADDSVTIQKVIELTFMDDDYEVRAVGNGDEALAMLTALTVDFVIADVHMPGASGYEVCRRSKQLRPEVPVLLLVGTFEPFDEAQARECGADSYLKKPFDSQELLGRVHELLAPKTAAGGAEPEGVAAAAAPAAVTGAGSPDSHAAGAPSAAAPTAAAPSAAAAGAAAGAGAQGTAASGAPGAGAPASGEPAASAAAAPAATAAPGQGVRLTGEIEAAATWQEFELEAEPEFIPDPWPEHERPAPSAASTMVPASPGHFEQPFALGDLEEQEATPAPEEPTAHEPRGEPLADAAPAAPPEIATGRLDQPFTLGGLGGPLDDHAFLLDEADVEAEPPAAGGPPLRATQAEPVSPYAASRSTAEEPRAAAPSPPSPAPAVPAAPPAPAAPPEIAAEDAPTLEERAGVPLGGLAAAEALAAASASHAGHTEPAAAGNGQPAAATPASAAALGDQDVDRIARRVVELLGDKVVRDIAWEVIPDLAEVVIKDRLRELESQLE
jgi:CheY-like chemotaxis protein